MKTHRRSVALTRRSFLQKSSAVFALTYLPGHVLGLNGQTPPSEKLNIAGIGVAGQGGGDIANVKDQNIVALCDVDWAHAAGTFKAYPKAKPFKDYRKMLDEVKEIDAVIVATPDHHHAFASIAAMRLGKHCYCEKPLTHSVWEARRVAEVAREMKVATQMGNQGQATEATRILQEMVGDGAIGDVLEAHVWTDRPSNGLFGEYWPQGVGRPGDQPKVPDTMGWDLWLGPAPERPYHPAYAPFRWRGWWDFGTGALGDIGCHSFDPVFRAIKVGPPASVEASSSRVNKETYPLASMVTYEFPTSITGKPVKVVWHDGGLRPERPRELEEGRQMNTSGALLIGTKGKILSHSQSWRLLPESRMKEYGRPPQKLTRSPGHFQEWIAACKGGAPAGSNFAWAGPLTETVLLGNIALRPEMRELVTEKKLLWDSKKFEFTNAPEANAFLRRDYRAGWTI